MGACTGQAGMADGPAPGGIFAGKNGCFTMNDPFFVVRFRRDHRPVGIMRNHGHDGGGFQDPHQHPFPLPGPLSRSSSRMVCGTGGRSVDQGVESRTFAGPCVGGPGYRAVCVGLGRLAARGRMGITAITQRQPSGTMLFMKAGADHVLSLSTRHFHPHWRNWG